jgi:hypothetical protein
VHLIFRLVGTGIEEQKVHYASCTAKEGTVIDGVMEEKVNFV